MLTIISSKGPFRETSKHFEDDDFIDRLNHRWTFRVLIMCIFVIAGGVFWGKAISCWTPTEFNGQHIEYTNTICWLRGSYYLPTDEIHIINGHHLFFLFPRFLWQATSRQTGVNIRRLVKTIKDNNEQDKGVNIAKQTLELYLHTQNKSQRRMGCICCHQNCSYGHTLAYFGVKFLYLINTISQFFLLNAFLSFHFTGYGIETLQKTFNGEDWFESPRFPRVTMCDFMVRRLGSNIHWYSVQCNLPYNMYNEKIFLAIWFWLIILSVLNILSMISWIFSLTKQRRLTSIKRYLKISSAKSSEEQPLTTSDQNEENTNKTPENFLHYLRLDGYLFFRLISRNTNEVVAGKIFKHLYEKYKPSNKNSQNHV